MEDKILAIVAGTIVGTIMFLAGCAFSGLLNESFGSEAMAFLIFLYSKANSID